MFGELLVLYLGSVAITAAVTKVRNMQADRKLKKNKYQIKSDERELGEKATIIATGGYSAVISNYLRRKFDYINPDLTLIGAKILFEMNK